MAEAFISYSRKDKRFIQKLHAAFQQHNRTVWVDWEDIPLTGDWRQEIWAGIEAADNFVFVISPDSVASKVCGEELDHAIESNKRLIPVLYRETESAKIHPQLERLNWVLFQHEEQFDTAFQALLTAIDTDLDQVKAHTRLLVRAIEWEHKQQDSSLLLRGRDLSEAAAWLTQGAGTDPEPTALHRRYINQSREAETKRQRRTLTAVSAGAVVATGLAIAAGVGWYVANQRLIKAQSMSSALLSASGQPFDALLASLQAATHLHNSPLANLNPELRSRVLQSLQEALYGVREKNRLVGSASAADASQRAVYSVSFSPDGQTLVSASASGDIKLWSREGRALTTLNGPDGHQNAVYRVRFSPDGQTLASASADGTVKLWDADGTLRHTLQDPASANSEQRPNPETSQPAPQAVLSVAFSPDGQMLASAHKDGTIKLWGIDGTWLETLAGHTDADIKAVNDIAFMVNHTDGADNPDELMLVSAGADNTLRLWQRNGMPHLVIPAHQRPVRSVVFNSDRSMIASASEDGTVRFWRLDGTLITQLSEASVVHGVAFSPDGETLVTSGGGATVNFWNLPGVLYASQHHNHDAGGTMGCPSDDHQTGGSPQQTYLGHNDGVYEATFSPDGEMVASASADGTIRLWSRDGIANTTLRKHHGDVMTVAFRPDNNRIVSAGEDGMIQFWNPEGEPLESWRGHQDLVHGLSFSPDGQTLASAGWDGVLKLWNQDGIEIWSQAADTEPGNSCRQRVYGVDFSLDGQRLVSANADHTLKVWDLAGNGLQSLAGHTDVVHNVSFSGDGDLMASASHDKTVRLWNIRNLKQEGTPLEGHTNWVHAVAFSPDGQTIASASHDRTVRLWDRDGTPRLSLIGHTDKVLGVAFSNDGKIVASSSEDHTVRLWQAEDGALITTLRGHGDQIHGLKFSPDDTLLASGSDDDTVILWDLSHLNDLGYLIDESCEWLKDYLTHGSQVPEPDGNQDSGTVPRRLCRT